MIQATIDWWREDGIDLCCLHFTSDRGISIHAPYLADRLYDAVSDMEDWKVYRLEDGAGMLIINEETGFFLSHQYIVGRGDEMARNSRCQL